MVPVVESTKNINQLMEEFGFKDITEQSIWTKFHGDFYIVIQATMGETKKHQDLWHLTIKELGKEMLDVSDPSLGNIFKQYFMWQYGDKAKLIASNL
ncbi:MAG: hypothetical protein KAS32_04630 [Candidatus Peribacteraceae bacterium]|nr:hypothetical protein [Candidatus Peribacteraceae bacterium]